MNKKKGILGFSVLFAGIACLFGCSTLHVHDADSPWYHSETEHWQVCTKCHKEFNRENHTFDENTCHICEYVDPVFNIDKQGVMTSLTAHGKEKTQLGPSLLFDEPEFRKVKLIGDRAFEGSKAVKVRLPKETIGYNVTAFKGTEIDVPDVEETAVTWHDYKGMSGEYKLKENLIDTHDVECNGIFYDTLQDCLNAVHDEDATITLLKSKVYDAKTPITVKSNVTISSMFSFEDRVSLNCTFEVASGKTLRILSNRVKYEGTTYLPTGILQELHGTEQHECLTSGSLVFNGTSIEPEKVFVYYTMDGQTHKAAGAKQTTTKALIFESENYAYGTLRFSKDYKQIMGLTEFGQTVTELTIHSVLYDPIETSIVNSCFIRHGEEKITIKILWSKKEITVSGNFQKGRFSSIILGKKIVSVGNDAFSTAFESSHMDQTLREAVALIMCPLITVTVGDDVREINPGAFRFCSMLENVYGGLSLTKIGWAAFADCYKLTQVDFGTASNLQEITNSAFGACNRLQDVRLPVENWVMGGKESYPVTECTPANFAFWLKTRHVGQTWNRNVSNQGCYRFNPNNKDQDGHHNQTKYFNNLQEAINNSNNDSIIHITKNYGNKEDPNKKIENLEINDNKNNKNVRVIADEGVNVTIENLTVGNGCSIIFNGNVTIGGNVILSKMNNNRGQAGFAVEKDVGKVTSNNVWIKVNKTAEFAVDCAKVECKVPDLLDSSKEKEYIGYGVCDFSIDITNSKEELISLSNFGVRCSSIELKQQNTETGNVDIVHNFGTNNGGHNILKKITFGDVVKNINQDAFKQCSQLAEVKFGKDLIKLEQGAFYESSNLIVTDFSSCTSLEKIGNGCFKDCKIQTVDVSHTNALNYIGQNAFLNNNLNYFAFHEELLNAWSFEDLQHKKTKIFKEDIENPNNAAKLILSKTNSGNFVRT